TTATIVDEFRVDRGYFSGEYGNAARGPIHVQSQSGSGFHGTLFWNHNNSVFTARSFFQVGSVQPARQNQYAAAIGTSLWKNAYFFFSGSQDKNRGAVNGNILTIFPSEHVPLTTDPTVRAIVQNYLDAYPYVSPNRPDISARALNTNSPQLVNTDFATGQLSQRLSAKDTLISRYSFTGQRVDAFQFVKGQNPNTSNKNHAARLTLNQAWSSRTVTDFSLGFDRQGSLLVPAEGAVGPIFPNGLQMLGPQNTIPIDRA